MVALFKLNSFKESLQIDIILVVNFSKGPVWGKKCDCQPNDSLEARIPFLSPRRKSSILDSKIL